MAANTGNGETPQHSFRVTHEKWRRAGEVLAQQNSDRSVVLNRALDRVILTAEDPEWETIRRVATQCGFDNVDALIDDVMRRWVRRTPLAKGLRIN